METITLDNIYKLMLNFGKLYDIISDEEKKSLITYLIKEIQICPAAEDLHGGFYDQEKGHQQGNRATVLCGR